VACETSIWLMLVTQNTMDYWITTDRITESMIIKDWYWLITKILNMSKIGDQDMLCSDYWNSNIELLQHYWMIELPTLIYDY
jgi:hypothetical protein